MTAQLLKIAQHPEVTLCKACLHHTSISLSVSDRPTAAAGSIVQDPYLLCLPAAALPLPKREELPGMPLLDAYCGGHLSKALGAWLALRQPHLLPQLRRVGA